MAIGTDKLPRLSASKLKMYLTCPKQYLNRYRDKQDGNNIWAVVGTAAHDAIETYYKDGIPIYNTFMEKMSAINPNVKGYEYLPDLQNDILRGLNQFNPDQYTVLEIEDKKQLEKHFRLSYPLDNPICTLEGYIDHVTPDGFIDYKTGKDRITKKKLKNDLQFAVYFYAYEILYGKKPEYGIYYRLRDNREIKITEANMKHLDQTIRTMLADPMIYDDSPCDTCPAWCGVRKNVIS